MTSKDLIKDATDRPFSLLLLLLFLGQSGLEMGSNSTVLGEVRDLSEDLEEISERSDRLQAEIASLYVTTESHSATLVAQQSRLDALSERFLTYIFSQGNDDDNPQ